MQQSTISNSKEILLTPRINQIVWSPWWKEQLTLCQQMIDSAIKSDYEQVARMISI